MYVAVGGGGMQVSYDPRSQHWPRTVDLDDDGRSEVVFAQWHEDRADTLTIFRMVD